jgi:hypothetical protein
LVSSSCSYIQFSIVSLLYNSERLENKYPHNIKLDIVPELQN